MFASRHPLPSAALILAFVTACWGFPLPSSAEDSASTRKIVDLSVGKGFVGRKIQRKLLVRQIHGINWVEAKIRLLDSVPGLRAIGLQLGTQQTEEITKNTLCRTAPSIAGRIYCSTADSDLQGGPQYTALYAGIQTELIEMATLEPRPLRIYVGTGYSQIQSTTIPSNGTPYTSVEIVYESRRQFTAKAALYISPIDETSSLGIAMPGLSVSYYF
ncbi:MAG TPA: hypothetical protein DCS07_00580 [Bdellovibrionales bacterium]|nr:MAG: hypothetical protein A2Z97_10070 [Bdellovibrionales bacterium GWB1_52_6]OFZ05265.1 MAG: hypothetical protein A2X97_10780 [Bdellovibrionales bacterium GWA1_52_35]OFZ42791.1 MAG: hypothetical protein A2070_07760 [Bdellovibrionales bacterium GWC1_52_8]HAR41126.1 hypothetical protein [Bdellovibrionales bacterium]HCM38599.1 hypothetical protein [Bdellovibrionales bacterium]